jgi:hypothetical protein
MKKKMMEEAVKDKEFSVRNNDRQIIKIKNKKIKYIYLFLNL